MSKCEAKGCNATSQDWRNLCDVHSQMAWTWAMDGENAIISKCEAMGITPPPERDRMLWRAWHDQAIKSLASNGGLPCAYQKIGRTWTGKGSKIALQVGRRTKIADKWSAWVKLAELHNIAEFSDDDDGGVTKWDRSLVERLDAIEAAIKQIANHLKGDQ